MRSVRGPLGHARLALMAILTASCSGGDAITEVRQATSIAVNATFPEGMTAAAFAQANLDRAEIKIYRGETEVVAQRTLDLPGGFNQVVDVVVILQGDTEDLDVRVEVFSGSLLAYSGGAGVTAIAGETVVTPEFTLSPRAPVIGVTTGQLTFTESPGTGLLLPLSFQLRNDGIGTMSWSSSTSQTWLSVNPVTGDLGPGASQIVQLRASKAGLAPGTHTATVQINGSGIVGAPISLEVSLNVATGRQLSVSGTGTGNGNVSSNPAGIACAITAGTAAGACASTYTDGTTVTLTAAPNTGSVFAGWAGAGCAGLGACQVTLTQAESVTATFNLRPPSNQDPTARFTVNCSFLTCTFNGSASSDPDGSISAYAWSFGDGSSGSGATTSHTFAASGSYTVALTVTDNAGATGTISRSVSTGAGGSISGQVFVDLNKNDTFDGSDTPLSGATVTLSSGGTTTTDASGSYSFGNLSPGTVSVSVSGVSSQYVYGGSQAQPISVTVTAGQSSTADFPYDLANQSPSAAFTVSCSFLTCTFDGSTSSDPDGTISAYAWSFGDGSSGTGVTTSHTFAASGSYTVRLTVTDNAGATGTVSRSVSTGAGGSIAGQVFVDLNKNDSFDGSDTPLSGATVTLSSGATTTTDASGSYSFGNLSPGTVSVSVSGVSSQYVYGGSQPQPISVTVTAGQSSSADFPYDLANQSPTAAFTVSCSFLTCTFDGSTSSDPDGTISAYAWSFGDGSSGTGVTTSHTFAASGSYTVRLTVTDNAGATGTVSRSVTTGAGGSIAGDVFVDLNGNDTFDGSDTPLSGATVTLSSGGTTTTDASGSYSFSNLSPGTVSVSVSGVSSQYVYGGSQPQPISVTVTAGKTSTADFPYDLSNPPPAAPSNVAGFPVSEFELDLSWIDQSNNEDLFEVELRQENTTTWVPQGTTGPNVEILHLGNLPQGASFDARVRACRSGSCSVWVRSPQLVFTYLTPPDPSHLQITSADATAVTIVWQDNSFTEDRFVIEHGSLTSAWVQVGTVGPDVTTFTDFQNTTFGEPIFYRVSAENSFGRSGESTPDSVTIPPPGHAPVISNISVKLIQVNDASSCSFQSPVGSLFEIVFDYDDLDADVTPGIAILQNDWAFNPQRTGTFFQPPDPGFDLSGEGGIGTGYSLQCHTFVNDQVVNVTLTLYDDAGLPSNPLSININRPSGANAPAGAPPVAGSSAIASGGAKPSNE